MACSLIKKPRLNHVNTCKYINREQITLLYQLIACVMSNVEESKAIRITFIFQAFDAN